MSGLPAPIYNFVANSRQLPYPTQFSRASIGGQFRSNGQYGYTPAGVPRFGHDPLTGVCKGLWIESATSFLDSFDSQYDRPGFTRIGCDTGDTFINPITNTIGQKIIDDMSTGEHILRKIVSVQAGQAVSMSMYIAGGERYSVLMRILDQSNGSGTNGGGAYVDANNGSISKIAYGTGVVTKYSLSKTMSQFYVASVSVLADASITSAICDIIIKDSSGSLSYTGDGASGIYISNIKICAGPYPTSQLPTGWETTSTTSADISTGVKTFTVGNDSTAAGQSIPTGATVRAWQTSNPDNYLSGLVTSHSGTTISLNITATGGSGTGITDWTMQAGASVTRPGDICLIDLSKLTNAGNPLWSGAEGTIVIHGTAPVGVGTLNQSLFSIDDNSMNNRIIAYRDPATRFVFVLIYVNGIVVASLHTGVLADSTDFSIAISFNSANCIVALNGGVPITTQLIAIPQDATIFRLGCNAASLGQFDGLFSLLQIYNRYVDAARISTLSIL